MSLRKRDKAQAQVTRNQIVAGKRNKPIKKKKKRMPDELKTIRKISRKTRKWLN